MCWRCAKFSESDPCQDCEQILAKRNELRQSAAVAASGAAVELERFESKPAPQFEGQLAALLDALETFVRRFVVLSDAQAVAVVLWIGHTHAHEAAQATPYLAVTSAEKRSGKSRLLEVLALLVRNPLKAVGATEAALFRSLGGDRPPTVLFDEVDAIFGPKSPQNEGLRAILNAGYTRGTPVLRCVGEGTKQKVEAFQVFGPKALAGIGKLPDTIADRSLPIRLKRRSRTEHVDRFLLRAAPTDAAPLVSALSAWAEDNLDLLADARPELPDALDDRAQDVCEALLAIADLAGPTWAKRARRALIEVRGGQAADEDTTGVRLLAACQTAFETEGVARLSTVTLIEALAADAEQGWDWVTPRTLATRLGRFEIHSTTVALQDGTRAKGYKVEDFADVWDRYLPRNGPTSVTSVTSQEPCGIEADSQAFPEDKSNGSKTAANPHEQPEVTQVTDKPPHRGDTGYPDHLLAAARDDLITETEALQLHRLHDLHQRAEVVQLDLGHSIGLA
jgi:Protein of unknown function (DUF3631)